MDSPPVDDPYLALGVGKDADSNAIKSAYRKLALKCHPDKVTDPSLKEQKANEFHKIHQAYEILINDDKRRGYDARTRLAELKAELLRRDAARSSKSPPTYDVRTVYSQGATFEVRTPKFTEEYEPRPASARKQPESGSYNSRRSSPATSKADKERKQDKEEDKARSERRRARDASIRDSRERKYYSSQEDVDNRARFEEERKKRDDTLKQRERAREELYAAQAEERKRAQEAHRAAEALRRANASADDYKYSAQESEARRYQTSTEQSYTSSSRPQPTGTESSRYRYEVRRSRVDSSVSKSRRRSPESADEKPTRTIPHAKTAPAEKLREMVDERVSPQRSYSAESPAQSVPLTPPLPRRAETLPVHSSSSQAKSSSRRRQGESTSSSKLRQSETAPHPMDSGYFSSSPGGTQRYHYPLVSNVTASPTSPYNTESRTPKEEPRSSKERKRSGRDEVPTPFYRVVGSPPRASSYSRRSPDAERERERERDRRTSERRNSERERASSRREQEMKYGELPSEYTRKNNLQSPSYRAAAFFIGKGFTHDDISFSKSDSYLRSGREREKDRGREHRPTLSRFNTFGGLSAGRAH